MYEVIKLVSIYAFIIVSIVMTITGVLAIWGVFSPEVAWSALATVLVVGIGSVITGYTATLLDRRKEKQPEDLPTFMHDNK